MNRCNRFASLALIFTVAHLAAAQATNSMETRKPNQGIASSQVIDDWVTLEEQKLARVADAMPADKYGFVPTNGEFAGVRSFAAQLKHLSATNFILGAAILGQSPPADAGDETGPDSLRTKADVVRYLHDSFVYLHKAVATLDNTNDVIATTPISPLPKNSATRLGYAVETLMHGLNHYGQLVEYLRMNGIVPPDSRLAGPKIAPKDATTK